MSEDHQAHRRTFSAVGLMPQIAAVRRVLTVLVVTGLAIIALPPNRVADARPAGHERSLSDKLGTRFTSMALSARPGSRLQELSLPSFPGANAIWGASGRDDRGHIWFGVSVQEAEGAHLIEYDPEGHVFTDHGDPITALRRAGIYREGEKQIKIHSKIVQADDGWLYFASMDEEGERADGSRLPIWGSHFWRFHAGQQVWEHLFAAPEGLIAVSGMSRWVYALGYWGHVLYQYDTHTGGVRRVRVGAEGGHISRNLFSDLRGHVYVPRVAYVDVPNGDEQDASGEPALAVVLAEYNQHLEEVASVPLVHYAVKGKPRRSHGIVGFSYLVDGSVVFATHVGRLHRVHPSSEGPAEVEDIGWFHPEGRAYTASMFPLDGKRLLIGVCREKRERKGRKKRTKKGSGYELLVYDLERRECRAYDLDVPALRYLLLYGSNTRDNRGRFYLVGRHSWTTPLVFQLELESP